MTVKVMVTELSASFVVLVSTGAGIGRTDKRRR